MTAPKSTFKFIIFTVTLMLFLGSFISIMAAEPVIDDDDDDEGFEELLRLDQEEQVEEGKGETIHGKLSEAEILRRAQRIVVELSNENAKKIIDGTEFVLLLGYAPWCPRSAELMPRFAEAAMALKEMGSPLLMAKLDAERHEKAASKLGIKGFPTMLLFVNGSSQLYTGGFTGEEIVIWAQKKTGVPVIRLSSITAAEEFVMKHHIFTIGLFQNFEGPDYEEFVKAAATDNEVQFVETTNIGVTEFLFPDIKYRSNTCFIGLVKSEPERFVKFDEAIEEAKILQFLDHNKFPLVTTLTELNAVKVYSSPIKLQVFIFASADGFKNLRVNLESVARNFNSKIMFVYVDTAEDNLAKPFLTLFGLESENPIVTAFDNRIGSKYLFESELTPINLKFFCLGLLYGNISPYFKSEPIPDTKGIIQAVVGRTFDALVLSSSENVFLEVYTPWCIECEATSKQIEKLAKHFEGLENLIFARIDASLNEHPKLQVNDYPALLFYTSENKSDPIKLSTKSSLKDLIAFINSNVRTDKDTGISASDQTTKDEL